MTEKVEDQTLEPKATGEILEKKDETVSKEAHLKTVSESMKWKEKFRDSETLRLDLETKAEAKLLEELNVEGKERERADMYKQKYEERLAAEKATDLANAEKEQKVINLEKSYALDRAVGGFTRPEYIKVAINLDEIKMNEDGSINEASLHLASEKVKREHSAVLKTVTKPSLPNNAPPGSENLSFKDGLAKCKNQKELDVYIEKHLNSK